jgi:hypothetical protein
VPIKTNLRFGLASGPIPESLLKYVTQLRAGCNSRLRAG